MASSKQKTALAIVVGAIVTITPSVLSYMQARDEVAAKRAESHEEAEASYKALSDTVKALQKNALEQHDYIVKLDGQLATLVSVLSQWPTNAPGAGSGSAGMRMTAHPPLPTIEPPPGRPDLPAPPDFTMAQNAGRNRQDEP